MRIGAGRTAQPKAEELVISVNGGPEQFVGALAQRQARQAFTGRGDIHRYESAICSSRKQLGWSAHLEIN